MNRKLVLAAAFAAASFSFAPQANAHLRNYLETYGYPTLEKGRYELELWNDRRHPDQGQDYFHHQTELEYGVTDRYTLGLYGVFIEGKGFSAVKLENRYRLSESGRWPVDTALYFEIKDANGRDDEDELEGKLIVSKDRNDWNFTSNAILELEREIQKNGSDEWELEPALALAAAYKGYARERKFTPGLELVLAENSTRLVPGLYIDLLPDVRLNMGLGIGLEKNADNWQLKSILEIEF